MQSSTTPLTRSLHTYPITYIDDDWVDRGSSGWGVVLVGGSPFPEKDFTVGSLGSHMSGVKKNRERSV